MDAIIVDVRAVISGDPGEMAIIPPPARRPSYRPLIAANDGLFLIPQSTDGAPESGQKLGILIRYYLPKRGRPWRRRVCHDGS